MRHVIPLIDEALYEALRAKRSELKDRAAYAFLPVAEGRPDLLFIGQATWGGLYDSDLDFAEAVVASGKILNGSLARRASVGFWGAAQRICSQVTRVAFGEAAPRVAVGWSNLAKIGSRIGNPDDGMIESQRELCVRSLCHELRMARPTATILLTGDYAMHEILLPALGEDGWRNTVPNEDRVAVKEHPELGLLLWGYHPRSEHGAQYGAELSAFMAGYAAAMLRRRVAN